jgi:hypothetical protein
MPEKVAYTRDPRPTWCKAFDSIEQSTTPWLDKVFASDDFHSALGLAMEARHQLEK